MISKHNVVEVNKARLKYQNSFLAQIYEEALKHDAKLVQSLSYNEDFETYFSIYYFLLYNGYFSQDNIFIYDNSNLTEILSLTGINIYTGSGVCRNISAHFVDLMSKIQPNKKLILVGTKYEKERICLKKTPYIVKNINPSLNLTTMTNNDTSTNVNHLEVMSFKNSIPILCDPTNFMLQKIINRSTQTKDYIDLSYDLIFARKFVKEDNLIEKLRKLKEYSIYFSLCEKVDYDKEYLYQLREKAIAICLKNKDKIKTHYQENNHLYKCLSKELIRIHK